MRAPLRAVAAALLAGVAGLAGAGDRPFLLAASAAAEEDDDAVWSVEAVGQRAGPTRGLAVAAEYAISPTDSLQFGWSRERERDGTAGGRSQSLEFEWKHLFNRIGRDGWGLGIALGAEAGRSDGGGDRSGWAAQAASVALPFTLALGDEGALLHLTGGVEKPRAGRREWLRSAAFELPLPGRVTGFAEAGRAGGERLLQAGVRHWVRRERFAIDLSLQRLRDEGGARRGVVVGLGWYDL